MKFYDYFFNIYVNPEFELNRSMNIIDQIIKCLFTPTYSNIDAILTWQYHNK